MHEIKARLSEEFMKITSKKRHSVGGKFHTCEWITYNVDKRALQYLKNRCYHTAGGVDGYKPIQILEIEDIPNKVNTHTEKKIDDKPEHKKKQKREDK